MAKEFFGEAANFPGAPKNFDPANPLADKVAAIQQREHIVREKLIKVETAKVRAIAIVHPTTREREKKKTRQHAHPSDSHTHGVVLQGSRRRVEGVSPYKKKP